MSTLVSLHVSTKQLSPFTADPLPWQAPPPAADICALRQEVPGVSGDTGTRGFLIFPVFRDNTGAEKLGPTVTFTVWFRDSAGDCPGWIQGAAPFSAVPQRLSNKFVAIQNLELWIQVTAVAGAAAGDTVEFRAVETPVA